MRCCPPNRGCNLQRGSGNLLRGGEECLGKAARRAQDRELRASVDFWWQRYRQLPPWRLRARHEALCAYREVVGLAFSSGLEPLSMALPVSWGAGFDREQAIARATSELSLVCQELTQAPELARPALETRRQELEQRLAGYRNPKPGRLNLPAPKPPSFRWSGLPETT
jgi:hypothetical protein